MLAAATLMLLHLAAFFQADDIIMREIPGSHPYLTGLGILGGIYSFANPLQGTEPTFSLASHQWCFQSCCQSCSGCVQNQEWTQACIVTRLVDMEIGHP